MNHWVKAGTYKEKYTEPLIVRNMFNVSYVKKITEACGKEFGINLDISCKTRVRPHATAKQIAIYFIREKLKYSWHLISIITDQDHSTAIYSHKTVSGFIDIDKNYKELISRIERCIDL